MLDARHIVELQEEATRRWHEANVAEPSMQSEFDGLVLEQHRANFELWHEEDKARDPRASDGDIAGVKRAIDRLNQRRNDLMERVDQMLMESGPRQQDAAALHSETPGMMIDRLSILELKRYHTAEEAERADADEDHRARNRGRLRVLCDQRDDLRDCLDQLWEEIGAGKRRFKLYRQMKMYNDPALNPVLYSSGGKRGRDAKI